MQQGHCLSQSCISLEHMFLDKSRWMSSRSDGLLHDFFLIPTHRVFRAAGNRGRLPRMSASDSSWTPTGTPGL